MEEYLVELELANQMRGCSVYTTIAGMSNDLMEACNIVLLEYFATKQIQSSKMGMPNVRFSRSDDDQGQTGGIIIIHIIGSFLAEETRLACVVNIGK